MQCQSRPKKYLLAAFQTKLPKVILSDELFALFAHYGNIEDLSMPYKTKDENKGYAFITFEDPDSVFRVFSDLKKIVLRAKAVK